VTELREDLGFFRSQSAMYSSHRYKSVNCFLFSRPHSFRVALAKKKFL